jgi:hypothetical protein
VLSTGAYGVLNGPGANYVGYMMRGRVLFEEGHADQAVEQAKLALASMEWQLPLAARLAELQPTAAREAALAFLIYNRSRYVEILLPTLAGTGVGAEGRTRYRGRVAEASVILERALARGGSLGHSGRQELRREEAEKTLASWRREL